MFTHNSDELVAVERKLACTFKLEPCDYFDRKVKVWLRAQADLLVINNLHALSVDWKTGKEPDPRYEVLPPNFQLRLTALLIFLHYPGVDRITSKYIYLNEGTATSFEMAREDLREFIPQVFEFGGVLNRAVRTTTFRPARRACANGIAA